MGSLLTRPQEEEASYFQELRQLPAGVIDLVMSPKTGAYLRGLAKTYNVPVTAAPAISFEILQIGFGRQSLANLANNLMGAVKIPANAAQLMAKDIERDLFAPVLLELNQYVTQLKVKPYAPQPASGLRNVLDLKSQKSVPPPLPMPPAQ